MEKYFQLLKDSILLTRNSVETVANNVGGENGLVLTSCGDTLQANITYINALELVAQTNLAERNALLTFINNKGLLNEFYGKK